MEGEFNVEHDVSLTDASRLGRKSKYPWREMKAGDSFFVPLEESKDAKALYTNMHSLIHAYRGRFGRFTARLIREAGVAKGVRVWKLSDEAETPSQIERYELTKQGNMEPFYRGKYVRYSDYKNEMNDVLEFAIQNTDSDDARHVLQMRLEEFKRK